MARFLTRSVRSAREASARARDVATSRGTRSLETSPSSSAVVVPQVTVRRGTAQGSSSAVLGNPLNYTRAVPLTYEQFRYAFANVVEESEAHELYENERVC